jgi:hypothetical protein
MRSVGDLDHAVVLVRDLDEAERRFAALGFKGTPRGYHSTHMGTANTTIVLPDRRTYLELLGVVAPTPANATQRAQLARREGLYGLAFKTEDARAAAAELAAAGLGQGDAVDFARAVELPDGTREARFTVARGRDDATPGAWCFLCQHHTPELVWRADHLQQPNGARALVEIVGCAAELDLVEAGWRAWLDRRVECSGEALRARTGTAFITFLEPQALHRRYGAAAEGFEGGEPCLALMAFAVDDPERARALLEAASVPTGRGPGGSVVVPATAACGVAIEFRPAGAG